MNSVSFNNGWAVRPKTSIFETLQGAGSEAVPVRLPHDALIHQARSSERGRSSHTGYYPSATVEYSKTFDVPEHYRTKRVTVEFQGVYRDAVVYVNGVYAAQRPNGYSTFRVSLDAYLNFGETNTIRVESRAHEDSRWYTGVGIHRDTILHVTELVHFGDDGIKVATPDIDARRAVIEVATPVTNAGTSTARVAVDAKIQDTEGRVVASDAAPVTLRAGTTSIVRQRVYVTAPVLWSTESPTLYTLTSSLSDPTGVLEEKNTTFGIRTLQLDPIDGLRINGEVVKLRGACIHHDNGILGSATIGRAEERRVELLKEAGFNAIRSAHNPLSQPMLDACDRHGMLVMDETFDMWTEGKSAFDYSLSFPEWWERDVEAMVAKDFNHPSVIFYSIGNEIPETGTPLGSGWGRKIAEKIRSLDETRFITNSINGFISVLPDVVEMIVQRASAVAPNGVNAAMTDTDGFMDMITSSDLVTEKTAESFSIVDAAGLNYGDARYVLDLEKFPNRVIIGTETFPTHIDVNWRLVQDNPHVIGDFTWTGWDYLGESGIGRMQYLEDGTQPEFAAPYPWLAAWCGDIDITGQRRPASYYREIVFGLRHEPYIAVQRPQFHGMTQHRSQWTWSDAIASWTWEIAAGSPITVEVYSDAEEVELRLNGRTIGRQSAGREHSFRAAFELAYEPGTLEAIAITGGAPGAITSLRTATDDVELSVESDRTDLIYDDHDLAFISIGLRDRNGILATHLDRRINVEVTGSGHLQGLGSARPNPTEPYDATTHTTFDGQALAIVRPTGTGTITISVSSEGLPTVSRTLAVEPARRNALPPRRPSPVRPDRLSGPQPVAKPNGCAAWSDERRSHLTTDVGTTAPPVDSVTL